MALTVGLAGAGPWAAAVHGPTLAAGPETRLAGVWSRTAESARRLAERLGVPVFATFADPVAGAEAIAAAVAEAAVPSVMLLTYRFAAPVREFLARTATFTAHGGRAAFVSGAFLAASPYGHGWRTERGAVLDVGPHLL